VQLDLYDDNSGLYATIAPNGTFASNIFGVAIESGESDSIYGNTTNPDISITGDVANSNDNGLSSVAVNGDTETLTLKFSTGSRGYRITSFSGDPFDSTARFVGTIVATRTVIPEPGAIGVVGVIGASLLGRRRRRA
jgi:hypothetical protein